MGKARRTSAERSKAFQSNLSMARRLWGSPSKFAVKNLRELSTQYGLSVAAGDLLLFEGRWYVTHAGLLGLSQRRRCAGIQATLQKEFSDASSSRWIFKATVYKSRRSKGFVGYGDADPSNISTLVHGAEMRIAETRAVNRALRKAYGIGLCSVEELGSLSRNSGDAKGREASAKDSSNSSSNGRPRLRDQLCLLIRQHNLDPTLVKAYAADFCGTQSLKDAGRERIESFINHVAISAKENRDALIAELNSYARLQEARP
jgi:hypothetical protein